MNFLKILSFSGLSVGLMISHAYSMENPAMQDRPLDRQEEMSTPTSTLRTQEHAEEQNLKSYRLCVEACLDDFHFKINKSATEQQAGKVTQEQYLKANQQAQTELKTCALKCNSDD